MKNKATRHYSLAMRYVLSVTGKKVSRRTRGVAKAKSGCIPERFWDFPRGSAEQLSAKQHWDSSGKNIFLSMEDVLKYLVEMEGRPAEQVAAASPDSPGPR